MAALAVESILQGRKVLEAAPTADQTSVFWRECKKALAEPIAAGIIYKNETERVLEMALTGGRIRTKTAWDADSLRGDHADLLILDEYSIMKPDTWTEVGAPMLLDNTATPCSSSRRSAKITLIECSHKRWRTTRGDGRLFVSPVTTTRILALRR